MAWTARARSDLKRLIEDEGMCIADAADEIGRPYAVVYQAALRFGINFDRRRTNWTPEENRILTEEFQRLLRTFPMKTAKQIIWRLANSQIGGMRVR